MEAFRPDGTPLGEVWSRTWARDEASPAVPQATKRTARKTAPIEDKESVRRLDGRRQARAFADRCPGTTCVYVADSEADIYELYAEERGARNPVQWVIRLCQDRAVVPGADAPGVAHARLIRDQVGAGPVLFTQEITVRGRDPKVAADDRRRRPPRKDRTAVVAVRAATLTLRPPWRAGPKLSAVTVQVVQVREVDPPADDGPVEWLRITTLPVGTAEDVRAIIRYYTDRWMIEVLFRTLKSGCRVEERRFRTAKRVVSCVAVYLIVAWRTLFACRLGRGCPDLDCEAVFDPAEGQAVWMVVRREPPPPQPPGWPTWSA